MNNISKKRVVITGLGVVSPLGCHLDEFWGNLRAGRSGIAPLDCLPAGPLPFRSGGEVKSFTGDIDEYGPLENQVKRAIKKGMKVMCREIEMGLAAAQKALLHSGLDANKRNPDRCGVIFGCDYILTRPEEFVDGTIACNDGNGSFHIENWPTMGLPKVNPLWLLKYLPNMPSSHVAIYNDLRGPNNSLTVREASMNLALAEAASIVTRGLADAMLVGATGTRIHPLRTTHVSLIEKLASERPDPTQMACPFDVSRDGMVVGEGAGAILLESLEHAEGRGAVIWGELLGSGGSMVGSESGSDFLRRAILQALKSAIHEAGDRLPQTWHLHAHGHSSESLDPLEAQAIGDLFTELGKHFPVTAAKSYFGNLGAGSAAVEIIASLLALKHGWLFPILNLKQPCPEVTWKPAKVGEDPGKAVVHLNYTSQGQCSSCVIAG